jgi:hypothetical protein
MKISIKRANSEQRSLDEAWATMIKARGNWACAICGNDYGVAAHHIIPRENKQYRYCEDNGIPLCVKHHKFCRKLSAHNSPLAFFLWLQRFMPDFHAVAVQRTKDILKTEGIVL